MSERDKVIVPKENPAGREGQDALVPPASVTAIDRQVSNGVSQRRMRNIRRLLLILATAAIVTIAFDAALFVQNNSVWQTLAAGGGAALALALIPMAFRLTQRKRLDAAGYLIILGIAIVFIVNELVLSGGTLFFSIVAILTLILAGYVALPGRWISPLLAIAAYMLAAILANLAEPLPRYPIAESPAINIFVPLMLVFITVAVVWIFVRTFRMGTIRIRLLVSFVAMVLLPVMILLGGLTVGGLRDAPQSVANQLESVAILKESQINTWVEDLQTDLDLALSGPELLPYLRALAQTPSDSAEYEDACERVTARLTQVLEQTERYTEMFLIDPQGQIVAATDASRLGDPRGNHAYFREGLKGPYVQRPFRSLTDLSSFVFVSRPIMDNQAALGVLVGRASLEMLNDLMAQRIGLGDTGETYLVDATSTLLTPTRSGESFVWVSTEGIETAVRGHVSGAGLYENYRGKRVVGAYRWLPGLQVALLAEQEQAEALRGTYTQAGIAMGAGLLGVLIAVAASLLITRSIANPLARLAATATDIAAGDLTQIAAVGREDEIATMARAFNSMTAQLRGLIASLEQRVLARTQELERRSTFLQASAEVSHAAISILDTEELIRTAVELIREKFDLYYVGLFLVDETGEWAVLQAGTGQAGQAMLARGHRHRVGEGMVGWSIAHGEPRVASQAAEDTVRLASTELPETRSEAALPLRSRGRVLGAFTMQQTDPDTFDQDTIVALQTVADQVAVALDNASLFAESREATEAVRRAYGELSSQAWSEILHTRPRLSFRSHEHGIEEAGDAWGPEMEQALLTERTVLGDGPNATGKRTLAVPIKVRGQVVGVLTTYKPAEAVDWTAEEIALLETIAEQLDPALESARLYQDTQRRAAREHAIRQVTERMRRAVDVETIVQTTVAELAKVMGAPRAYVRLGTEADLCPGEQAKMHHAAPQIQEEASR